VNEKIVPDGESGVGEWRMARKWEKPPASANVFKKYQQESYREL
jgi:hypothetical protein